MKARDYWKLSLLIVVLLSPIILYVWVFGVAVSSDHTRWAEFGSAIGGIYSPMIAVFTLLVLMRQVSLQQQLTTHEFDQGYLQQARQDVEFYCSQLAMALNADALPGKSLRALLQENFRFLSASELKREDVQAHATRIHQAMPAAFDLWTAIYPILMGLKAGKGTMYVMTFGSSRQKLIALLSFPVCVALDNYCRAVSRGELHAELIFSEC